MIEIREESDCCGCGACAFICPKGCISMEKDGLGFEYPKVDVAQCIECGKCDRVCPLQNRDFLLNGCSVRWLGLRHADEDVVRASSSGGAFTTIIQAYAETINRNPVVYGAAWGEGFSVSHKRLGPQDSLDSIRKSKYTQSKMLGSLPLLEHDLKGEIPVVFSGTPCQIAAIRSLFGERENLLTIEVICKGVASPVVFEKWLEWLQDGKRSAVKSVDFRSRQRPEEPSILKVKFDDGKKYVRTFNTYDDPFTDAYLKGFICRDSCSVCPFAGMPRTADFTIGDYWGGSLDPNMPLERENGMSLVICNSERAGILADTFSKIAVMFDADENIAVAGNPSLAHASDPGGNKQEYLACFFSEGFDAARRRFATPRPWHRRLASRFLGESFKRKLKSIIRAMK